MKIINYIGGFFAGAFFAFIVFFIVGFIYQLISGAEYVSGVVFLIVVGGGGLIGFLIPFSSDQMAESERQARLEAERTKMAAECAAKNQKEHQELIRMSEDVNAIHRTLAPLLDQASLHVAHAEAELKDDSVGAFWDEVEGATRRLAQYNNGVHTLLHLTETHRKRRLALPDNLQPAHIEPLPLPDGGHLVSRLSATVKQARRNPQWETIFQQRRTIDILVKGFANLGAALESLQHTISDGLHDLAATLHESMEQTTFEYTDHVTAKLNDISIAHSEGLRERRQFEQNVRKKADEAVEILETVARRRH